MKGTQWKRIGIIVSFLAVAAFALSGCSGGSDGAAGPAGATGATGPAGPVTLTAESCGVCHGAGKFMDTAVAHPADTSQNLTVTVNSITDTGSGILKVAFKLTDKAGAGVAGVTFGSNRLYLADIVPKGTATASWGTWSTDYLERWAYEMSTDAAPGTWTDLGSGNYTYTFATAAGSAAALAEAPDYNAAHAQRLVMRVSADGYNNAVGIKDFKLDGTLLAPQRVLAPIDGCKKCHSSKMENAAHADGYLDTRACNVCHSPLGHYGDEMQADGAWLTSLVHKIHSAIKMDAFADRIWVDANGDGIRTADERHSYDAVTYPQDVKSCQTCHTGNEGMTDAWKANPTAEACGTCHTSVNFTTGANHTGGAQASNASCVVCHPATGTGFGKSVTEAHAAKPAAADTPEFDATITMTAPANGTHYVAGEAPMVTVTLKNHSDGTAVASSLYMTKDSKGVAGGGLSAANLYVYGPRAKAVPVLTTGSSTDSSLATGATPTQGCSLLLPAADPLVKSNATGFKYQLQAIPSTMTAGTYMVRFEGADYGGVSTTDYVTSTSNFITFQVGTATPSKKVAGDNCLNCHGDTRMHLTGSYAHNIPFDTDACLGCHDQSGNHAIPIGNRVHAVHSANSAGDLYTVEGGSRDWTDVTFPQGSNSDAPMLRVANCATCHSSGNTTYVTKSFMMPCAGCHVGRDGALDHMRQNGGPF